MKMLSENGFWFSLIFCFSFSFLEKTASNRFLLIYLRKSISENTGVLAFILG